MPPKTKAEVPSWEDNKKGALRHAKLLFYLEYSVTSISEATKIPVNTLKYHCFKKTNHWKGQRKEEQVEIFALALQDKGDKANQIVGLSMDLLLTWLKRQTVRGTEFETKDAKFVSDILGNVNRIALLAAGEPTDIKRYEHLTPTEVKEEARALLLQLEADDPMMELIGEGDEVYGQTRHRKPTVN